MATKLTNPLTGAANIQWISGLGIGKPIDPAHKHFTGDGNGFTVSGSGRIERNSSSRGINVNLDVDAIFLETQMADAVNLRFDTPVQAVAAQFAAMVPHPPIPFTVSAQATLTDGTTTPTFTSTNGNTTDARDGSAISMGIERDPGEADIASITFQVTSNGGLANAQFGYAIGPVACAAVGAAVGAAGGAAGGALLGLAPAPGKKKASKKKAAKPMTKKAG